MRRHKNLKDLSIQYQTSNIHEANTVDRTERRNQQIHNYTKPLSVITRISRQKIIKGIEDLTTIDQLT